jgi:predicted nucleic-acid-binding Zn-ribbon protein
MSATRVLDWTCSQCGASEIYRLVPETGDQPTAPPTRSEHTLPTLDWSCSHCGASMAYELVPMAAARR